MAKWEQSSLLEEEQPKWASSQLAPAPRYGSGISPEFPDLPDFVLSDELRKKTENSLYYSTQYGIPPEMAFDMESELTKQRDKLDLMSDIEKAIRETPENIKIGTVGLAASTMFAIKRRGMMLSGGGIFPDEMVKHQFEPIKPEKREKLTDWRERKTGYVPGMIRPTTKDWPTGTLAEAFGLVTRLPHVAGAVIQEEQRKMIEAQDQEVIKNAPITKAMRLVTQSGVPSMSVALGVALLTGDPLVALALLGEMEGGSAFQTQLEGGASIMKANVIGDLSEVAEIGGEMMVLPKLFKGVKEGFSLREGLITILENATQEGITGFNQRFLEVFGLETTKGVPAEEAAVKALNEGVKAIPENAWVGGASAGGPVMIRGGFDIAVKAVKGKEVGAAAVAKPIAEVAPTEAVPAPDAAVEPLKAPEPTITPVEAKPEPEVGIEGIEKEIQRAGITAEDFELKPEKMKELGLEKIAMKIKGKVYAYEYGKDDVFNHADVLQKSGAPSDTKTSDIVPGFIDKQGRFIEQFEKQPPAKAVEKVELERKVSRLAKRTEELAVEKQLTESLGELPTYETMKMADQAKRATKIIEEDYDKAKRIALGKEAPPQGLRPAAMYEAVKYKAVKDGDVETLRQLATESTIPAELSALGQEIKAADTRTVLADPVKAMRDIKKKKEVAVKKRMKIKSIKRETSRMTKEMRSAIRETTTRRQNWSEFAESIRC